MGGAEEEICGWLRVNANSGPLREVPGWGRVRMYLWKQISDNDIENIKNKIEIIM